MVHFTKQVGAAVVLRVAMSRQLTDTARAVSVVLEDPRPDCDATRWLAMAKNNLGARPPAHAYQILSAPHPTFDTERTAVVVWTTETLEGTADVVERQLEEQAAKARQQQSDPYGARGARGPRTQDAVSYLGEKLHELRDSGDVVVTAEELEQWRLRATTPKRRGAGRGSIWASRRSRMAKAVIGRKTSPIWSFCATCHRTLTCGMHGRGARSRSLTSCRHRHHRRISPHSRTTHEMRVGHVLALLTRRKWWKV